MIFHDYLISISYISQAPNFGLLICLVCCVILMCQHILHVYPWETIPVHIKQRAAKGLSSCKDKRDLFVHIMTFCHMHTCCFKVSLKWIGSSHRISSD